jgi:hypothetical protein
MNTTYIVYTAVGIIHNLFWVFVIFAFYNKKLAYFNLYYLIPATYILHILPFHILEKLKDGIKETDKPEQPEHMGSPQQKGSSQENSKDKDYKPNAFLQTYIDIQKSVNTYCYASPFSPQGLLIFGAVSSAYALKK